MVNVMGKSHFFFRTTLTDAEQENIISFYNNLSADERHMVDALMSDAVDEFEFNLND